MRCPPAPLWGLLWLWVPLAAGRPGRAEKMRADARNLTRTLGTRIRQLQPLPLPLAIGGLEAVPGEGASEGLGALAQRLQLFQRLLAALAPAARPLAQLANDLDNLGTLLAALAAQLGCPPPPPPPAAAPGPPPRRPPALPPALGEAPHSASGLALARLRLCLEGVAARLEGPDPC